jgi:hypothetical protein
VWEGRGDRGDKGSRILTPRLRVELETCSLKLEAWSLELVAWSLGLLLAFPSASWRFLALPGASWRLLAPPGVSWRLYMYFFLVPPQPYMLRHKVSTRTPSDSAGAPQGPIPRPYRLLMEPDWCGHGPPGGKTVKAIWSRVVAG